MLTMLGVGRARLLLRTVVLLLLPLLLLLVLQVGCCLLCCHGLVLCGLIPHGLLLQLLA